MQSFHEYLYQYGLHDCVIDNVLLFDKKIILDFNSGVYVLNSNGKEIGKTPKCKMIVALEDINPEKVWEHVEIYKTIKRKVYEVDFDKFVESVRKYKLDIDVHYYTYFCNTILLKGYTNNQEHEITISGVEKINFQFENSRTD